MAIESIISSLIAASPAKRREVERVLAGAATMSTNTTADGKGEVRLVSIAQASRLLALSRSTVYKLITTGRLDTVQLNGCQRITMRSIVAFINGERPANAATTKLVAESAARYAATKTPGI